MRAQVPDVGGESQGGVFLARREVPAVGNGHPKVANLSTLLTNIDNFELVSTWEESKGGVFLVGREVPPVGHGDPL